MSNKPTHVPVPHAAERAAQLDADDPEPGHHDPDYDPVTQYRGTPVDPASPLASELAEAKSADPEFDPVVEYRGTTVDPRD